LQHDRHGFRGSGPCDPERWVALAVRDQIKFGLTPGGELKVATTICSEIRDAGAAVVIDEVAKDEIYCSHPTPKLYGFQSYISVPIVLRNGRFFGTLCAIDPKPRRLNTPEMLGMFKLFAELIALQLDSQEQITATRAELASSEADLLDVRNTAQLREEFIAVLGHDLRNPIASVDAGVFLLLKQESDAAKRKILQLMRGSVVRMIGLVENLMDFARGKLGDGIFLDKKAAAPLAPVLEQVVSELHGVYPDRSLQTHIDLNTPINCDPRASGSCFQTCSAMHSRMVRLRSLLSCALRLRAERSNYRCPTQAIRFRRTSWATSSSRSIGERSGRASRDWDLACTSHPRSPRRTAER
jgi:signal transduction histidine kinase